MSEYVSEIMLGQVSFEGNLFFEESLTSITQEGNVEAVG